MEWYWWVLAGVVSLHVYIALGGLTVLAMRRCVSADAVPSNDLLGVLILWPLVGLFELLQLWASALGRIGSWATRDRSPKVPKAKTVKR